MLLPNLEFLGGAEERMGHGVLVTAQGLIKGNSGLGLVDKKAKVFRNHWEGTDLSAAH